MDGEKLDESSTVSSIKLEDVEVKHDPTIQDYGTSAIKTDTDEKGPVPPSSTLLNQITRYHPSPQLLFNYNEQANLFRNIVTMPMTGFSGPFIPQKMCISHTTSNRRHHVDDIELEYPIMFATVHPDRCGIPLSDALCSRVNMLEHHDETQAVFERGGPSVSIRLEVIYDKITAWLKN